MSEPMTADAARKIVLAKVPNAKALEVGGPTYLYIQYGWYIVKPRRGRLPLALSHKRRTEGAAWLNAAMKLTHKE